MNTDAGNAYAKAPGNPSGPHALACELVGTRLAGWLGLPTFDLALIDYPGSPVIEFKDKSVAAAGKAILTRFVEGTTWGEDPAGLKLVANLEAIPGLVVFDTWTRNKDRYYPHGDTVRKNLGNVFLSADDAPPRKFRILAIDHTECFRENSGELHRNLRNIERVKDARVHGLFDEFVPHVTRETIAPFIARMRAFRRSDAEALVGEIPRDWDVNSEMRGALRDFMCDRAGFLVEQLPTMLAAACRWRSQLFN